MTVAPLRILLVSQEVPPETGWGGIGTYVGILAPALAAAGHEVHVLSVVPGQSRTDVHSDDGVVVHRRDLRRLRGVGRLSGLTETWGRWSLSRAVAREVDALIDDRDLFDVVESPNWNAEGLLLATGGRAPVVVRLHSWASQIFPHFGPRTLDARFAVRLEERLVQAADIVVGTRVQIDDAGSRLGIPPDALRVVPPPVPVEPLGPPPPGPPSVLFVGRLEARKGPETVVAAFRQVARAVPGARLVLAGGDSSTPGVPSYAAWLRELAHGLGVGDRLEIVGRAGADAVTALRRQASVCVMPSRWESFGYVAAEGLAAGRPVVASDVGGLREVVDDGETGFLVGIEDADAWAAALVTLLRDPDRAAGFGRLGARRMEERYAPRRIAALTVDAYSEAVRRFQDRHEPRATVAS